MDDVHTETLEQTSISTSAASAAPASSTVPKGTEPSAPANQQERKLLRETALELRDGLSIAFSAAKNLVAYLGIEGGAIEPAGEVEGEEAAPNTDRMPPIAADVDGQGSDDDHVAPVAFRSDGVMLLHAKWLPKSARKGRPLWKGIVLSGVEAELVKNHLDGSAHEAASRLVGAMKRGK
jgi:hypothetical protein